MGKSSINGPFSMAMLNNQRVYEYNMCLVHALKGNPNRRLKPNHPKDASALFASRCQKFIEQLGFIPSGKLT